MRCAAVALAAGMLSASVLSGCETTQEQSAKIARRLGHQSARPGTTGIGRSSRDVRVVRAAVIPGGPAAVALELANSGATAQAAIPVLIDVRDARGAVVYRNDTRGIEISIQQLALLPAHATAWWVDNEVLTAGGVARSVHARIGTGATAGAGPAITTRDVSASDSFPGPHVDVTLHNGGRFAQSQLAVYAVALRGGRVLGAGRALVPSLRAGGGAQAEIPMTGSVSGAAISVTVAAPPGR